MIEPMGKEIMKILLVIFALICTLQVKAQSDGDMRLVDGVTYSMGRLEVFIDGEWGTVCDDRFTSRAANVVCRSLGFSDARPKYTWDTSGGGSQSRILLDEVQCNGDEASLLQCSHAAIGVTDCRHREDVIVDCYGQDWGKSIELVNGTSTSGVLVLNRAGLSATVRYDGLWGSTESRVVCTMLGYNVTDILPITVRSSFFGDGTDLSIMMSDVRCRGNENNLSECGYQIGQDIRGDRDDVAIDCHGTSSFGVSLVNGNETYGEIQLTYHSERFMVCNYAPMYQRSLDVYCRMLGHRNSNGVWIENRKQINVTTSYAIRGCHGYESNIFECSYGSRLMKVPCVYRPVIACVPE